MAAIVCLTTTSNSIKLEETVANVNGYLVKIPEMVVKLPDPPSSPDQLYVQVLLFCECWHELIDEKDYVAPLGSVQYGADTYTAPDGTTFNTVPITELGIDQGYSAFGQWDSETVGRGIRWSTLTDEQKQSFASDPWNNIYVDGDKVIQVRYRVRVFPQVKNYLLDDYIENERVIGVYRDVGEVIIPTPQGKRTTPKGYVYANGNFIRFRKSDGQGYINYVSAYVDHSDVAYGIQGSEPKPATYRCIPIAIVARRNLGAFHPVYNPNGSRKFSGDLYWFEYADSSSWSISTFSIIGVNQDNKTFTVSGDQTDYIKPNYFITVSGSTGNDGRYWVTDVSFDGTNTVITVSNSIPDATADGELKSDFQYVRYCFDNADPNSGTIESGVSGRSDGLYADEINEGDVRDLRNYAPRVTDYQRLLEKEFNKLLTGEMRGWERPKRNFMFVNYAEDGLVGAIRGMITINPTIAYRSYAAAVNYAKDQIRIVNFNRYFNYEGQYDIQSDWDVTDDLLFITTSWQLLEYFCSVRWTGRYGVYKNILTRNIFSNPLKLSAADFGTSNSKNDGWGVRFNQLFTHEFIGALGDYGESFIPTDDFTATVDSSDNTKITISGDKRYAIKKNCRLFFRDSTNNKAGTLRVKTISYDSGNDQTVITTTVESGDSMVAGASVNVSTCIASGRAGTASEGDQVYVFKLSRRPKDPDQIKVLIRKKDGTWYAYKGFEPVSRYDNESMQTFIDNIGGTDTEVRFNRYLNWLGINITELYSTLGYDNEDDLKQNTVIEVYYVAEANPLQLDSGNHHKHIVKIADSVHYGNHWNHPLSINLIGKKVEFVGGDPDNNYYGLIQVRSRFANLYVFDDVGEQDMLIDLSDRPVVNAKSPGMLVKLPVILHRSGKLYLNLFYNEVLYDYETDSYGWEGALLVANYETTSTDANGNTFIAGQKSVELPYFVWNEDED